MATLKAPALTRCNEIAVIVPVSKNHEKTVKLLASFFENTAQAHYPLAIILVDLNAAQPIILPPDFSRQGLMMRVVGCENPGVAAARNKGAKIAEEIGATWLHFIDADCLFTATTLSGYLDDANQAVAYQGGIKALGIDWLSVFYLENLSLYPMPVIEADDIQGNQARPYSLLMENTLISLSAFRQVGGFDETLMLSVANFDMGIQLSHRGMLSYAPSSTAACDFLVGKSQVQADHIKELIVESRKYGYEENKIALKYGFELKTFEAELQKNPQQELNEISKRFLRLMVGMAFTEGVIQGHLETQTLPSKQKTAPSPITVAPLTNCKDIATIVPVKNNQNGIEKLLASFFLNTDKMHYPKEIILVDNNSEKLLTVPEHFLRHGLAITVLSCKTPGAGNARNKGAKLADEHGAKWLHFIDSDCLFTPTTLSGYLNDEDDALAYQGTIQSLGKDWLSLFYDENKTLCPTPVPEYNQDKLLRPRPLYIVTANVLVYLDAFKKIGGFDESFTFAAEDQDLGLQLSQLGRLAYAPHACAFHDFLGGSESVKAHHVLELIERTRKYGHGEKPILIKYGHRLSNLEAALNKNLSATQNEIPYRELKFITGLAFTQGVLQAHDMTEANLSIP